MSQNWPDRLPQNKDEYDKILRYLFGDQAPQVQHIHVPPAKVESWWDRNGGAVLGIIAIIAAGTLIVVNSILNEDKQTDSRDKTWDWFDNL